MNIKVYPRGSNDRISENFRAKEFDCKCGKCDKTYIDVDLVTGKLQPIRTYFGMPLTITSGYRCPTHNINVGGVSGSKHCGSGAVDFANPDIVAKDMAAMAEKLGAKGIGWYPDENFVHIDDGRQNKSYWKGHELEPMQTFTEPKVDINQDMLDDLSCMLTKNYNAAMKLINSYR